jgi:uncharacterized protein (DUF4213/DUF364 family)
MLIALFQGKKTLEDSKNTRDADILRWTMGLMSNLKDDIRIVTDEYKIKGAYRSKNIWSEEAFQSANNVSIVLQRIGKTKT